MASFPGDKFILEYVLGFLGTPYIYGGSTPQGIDCSGLVLEVLKARALVSNSFDCTAHDLYLRTKSGGAIKPEVHALAFYGTNMRITHVGYCVSDLLMVEAGGGKSTTLTVQDSIKDNAFVRLRPIFGRKDYLSVHLPDRSHFN